MSQRERVCRAHTVAVFSTLHEALKWADENESVLGMALKVVNVDQAHTMMVVGAAGYDAAIAEMELENVPQVHFSRQSKRVQPPDLPVRGGPGIASMVQMMRDIKEKKVLDDGAGEPPVEMEDEE